MLNNDKRPTVHRSRVALSRRHASNKTALPVLWLVQTNLGIAATPVAIRSACERNGLLFRGFERIPFSDELPHVDLTGR